MLANQKLLIDTMQACHKNTEMVLGLVNKACGKMSLPDMVDECELFRHLLKDTDSMFVTLRDASTADVEQVLSDVKKYASDVVQIDLQLPEETPWTLSRGTKTALKDGGNRCLKAASCHGEDLHLLLPTVGMTGTAISDAWGQLEYGHCHLVSNGRLLLGKFAVWQDPVMSTPTRILASQTRKKKLRAHSIHSNLHVTGVTINSHNMFTIDIYNVLQVESGELTTPDDMMLRLTDGDGSSMMITDEDDFRMMCSTRMNMMMMLATMI
ncbi:unnamed protein product [Symbiodinium sp. CCMP2592]|nr:unnamed protein product [Symbiodinium sp. CCMP2592]